MAGRKQEGTAGDGGIGGNISVGGSVTGSSLASGKNITATVNFSGPDAEELKRVLEALAAIQAELAKLPGPKAPISNVTVRAAVEAAKKEPPDRNEIGGLLETALKTARDSAEFAGVAAKLAPYVRTAAGWLGGQWTSLLGLLG